MKLTGRINKFGTAGLFLTAFFSPCCFPLFAFAGSALGLGSFELFGDWTMWIFQALVLICIAGFYLSYRTHSCTYPLLIAIVSGVSVFYGYNFSNSDYWTYFLYAGMFGLLIATIWDYKRNKRKRNCPSFTTYKDKTVELNSTITCPNCGHKKNEMMPTDACLYFHECEKCKMRVKPLQGDCCVYCSYGTVKCPPIQVAESCCWGLIFKNSKLYFLIAFKGKLRFFLWNS